MQALLLGMTALLACPAIILFLLLAWRFSWLANYPSQPWMLSAIILSGWAVFAIKRLSKIATGRSRIAADKIGMILVAIGLLWGAFLGLSSYWTLKMSETTGTVTSVGKGRAYVQFKLGNSNEAGYNFPEFDYFSTLRAGESVSVLNEWKTTEIASRTWVFTWLGAAVGIFLIVGGLMARHRPIGKLEITASATLAPPS